MAGGFRELEGITADVGLEAWGFSVEEALIQAGDGLASLISATETLTDDISTEIEITSHDLPGLLVNFLNEIIFLAETSDVLPLRIVSLHIDGTALSARMKGCRYRPGIHTRNLCIKAATYHGLTIEETDGKVTVRVIFDV